MGNFWLKWKATFSMFNYCGYFWLLLENFGQLSIQHLVTLLANKPIKRIITKMTSSVHSNKLWWWEKIKEKMGKLGQSRKDLRSNLFLFLVEFEVRRRVRLHALGQIDEGFLQIYGQRLPGIFLKTRSVGKSVLELILWALSLPTVLLVGILWVLWTHRIIWEIKINKNKFDKFMIILEIDLLAHISGIVRLVWLRKGI